MVNIVEGKDLIDHVYEYKYIIVGTSINNCLRHGFQRDVKITFPEVNSLNKKTGDGDTRKLGTVLPVKTENNGPEIILCYINKGNFRPDKKTDYLDYQALDECIARAVEHMERGGKVATTMLGCSEFDGNGDENKVKDILSNYFEHFSIDVYKYKQLSEREKASKAWALLKKHIKSPDYREAKKRFLWVSAFGKYKEMPDVSERELKEIIKRKREA